MSTKVYYDIYGMDKLKKSLKKLGDVPQKHVTASSKKGMRAVLKAAKADAPELSGDLKRGMILVGERLKDKGKKVYDIVFDRKMNAVFQKETKVGKALKRDKKGNVTERSSKNYVGGYYPVSQEYGYFAVNGRYIPGRAFTRKALAATAPTVEKIIVSTMKKKVDTDIAKGGLK